MKLELAKFKRALLLNHPKLPARLIPPIISRLTNTPRWGGRARHIIQALDFIRVNVLRRRGRLAQIAEFGVAAGEGLRQLAILTLHYCTLHKIAVPTIYGFDSFEGMHRTDHPADIGTWSQGDYKGNYEALFSWLASTGLDTHVKLEKGYFRDTARNMPPEFAPDFLLIDCDYYTSTRDVFDALKERLPSGAVVYFDDLGTNYWNRNLGEERLIHEVNTGELGPQYHLERLTEKLWVWSNSDKPVRKSEERQLMIPLHMDTRLGDFY